MANNRFDLQLDNNDIVIQDSDLILAESDDQHIIDTINSCQGWWKESPTDGVAILSYLKGRNIQQELSRVTKIQLQSDGYNSSPKVGYDNTGKLILDPNIS